MPVEVEVEEMSWVEIGSPKQIVGSTDKETLESTHSAVCTFEQSAGRIDGSETPQVHSSPVQVITYEHYSTGIGRG